MELIVTTDWLAGELGVEDLEVLDYTVFSHVGDGTYVAESGRANFETAHIPGAGFADLIADLADADSPWDFALPTPKDFGAAMERLGVADGRRVVLYDESGSLWASRVWLYFLSARYLALESGIDFHMYHTHVPANASALVLIIFFMSDCARIFQGWVPNKQST